MDVMQTLIDERTEARPDRWPVLAGYLLGRRASVLAVASALRLVWVGCLCVLAAGLAREYDGEYLVAEPWYVIVPLAVSVPMSLVLWTLLYWSAMGRAGERLTFWRYYLAFLSLYWMTAPLALLYGVPYERFLSA